MGRGGLLINRKEILKEAMELSALDVAMTEINNLQYIEDTAHLKENQLYAGHCKWEKVREVLQEMGMIPMIGERTGFWRLFL